MKTLMFALLVCFASSLAMEKEFFLDEKSIQEFKEVHQKIAEKGQDCHNADSNQFLSHCKNLAQQNNDQLREHFNQCKDAIKEVNDSVITDSKYKDSYTVAATMPTLDAKWELLKKTNCELLRSFLEKKMALDAGSTKALIEANSNLNDETLKYYDASSFLLFYARQMQRQETGKDLEPIVVP
jgi:hypothetical protein